VPGSLLRLRLVVHLGLALLLSLAALGLASPLSPAAQAAPQAIGVFTVTSFADTNNSDSVLTLREALLVANGGTGPTGLNRPASAGEQAALGYCQFTAGLITGGCGPGLSDKIFFASSLGVNPIVVLTASLPPISDTAPTLVDGELNGVFPVVWAALLPAGADAIRIASNNNVLLGLTIMSAPEDDLRVTGNSNQISSGVTLLSAGRFGLYIDGGQFNTADSVAAGGCGKGNQQGGIVLADGAMSNTVSFATVACNSGAGIRLDGGAAYNWVMTSTVRAQAGNGIEIVNGAHDNVIQGDTLTSNSQDGLLISGAATHDNVPFDDFIGVTAEGAAAGNDQYGVRIASGAHDNHIACQRLFNFLPPCTTHTVISGNGLGGVRMETGATGNDVSGSLIGLNPAGSAAVPNGGPGIDIDQAPTNTVSYWGFTEVIAGNLGPGVRYHNTTGGVVGLVSLGLPGLGNTGPGLEISDTTNTSAYPTVVVANGGAGIAIEGAASTGDLAIPYKDFDNGGLPIDLGNDGHTPNGAHPPPGPNNWLPYPVITAGSGRVVTGTACLSCTIVVYLASGNPAAPGGGIIRIAEATTMADAWGRWSSFLYGDYNSGDISLLACSMPCYQSSNSATSELSPRINTMLPVVRR
jgi:CSLREA domain-containing protein